MRIAQVSPLYESVPPQFYGGTERVISNLTEELVRRGHQVLLYASADSVTSAELVPCCPRALRLDKECLDPLAHHLVQVERVLKDRARFDLIHWHIDYLHYPLSSRYTTPHLTTLHGRLDIPDLEPVYREYPRVPLVSISDAQRRPLPHLNWLGTVYHGLPPDLFTFQERPGEYLAFLGRISPEKRVDRAVRIARRLDMPLKIAAKVAVADRTYFQEIVDPLLKDPRIEYLGEIGEEEKNEFLGNAYALLFPIDWPEPFGLVMIEAMACGTPVIAFSRGSVPEIMVENETGFVCQSEDEAVEALARLADFPRRRCRTVFETRFTAARMAEEYLAIYEALLNGRAGRLAA
jgi:glycosyltransferase involved in cell wall biosynthesis